MIGFEETEVQVPENIADGVKLLCVKVFEGELRREATVTVKYCDQSAVSKYELIRLEYNLNTVLTFF